MVKRIFVKTRDGFARATQRIRDESSGREYNQEIPQGQGGEYPISYLQAQGVIIEGGLTQNGSAFAIQQTEGTNGTKELSRLETSDIDMMEGAMAINIFIDNTSKSALELQAWYDDSSITTPYNAVNQKIPLFDGSSLIARALGLSATTPLNRGVTFGGDWGKDTFLVYKEIIKSTPIRFHELHLTVNDKVFYNQLNVEVQEAQLNGVSPKVVRVDIISLGLASDFNGVIRVSRNFRMLADALSSLVLNVPAGCTVNANLQGKSVGKAYSMVLTSPQK